MSLEIGNSAAVQLALIQVPVLVFFSAIVSPQYPFLSLFRTLLFNSALWQLSIYLSTLTSLH
jgi:Ca2+/H+ antiporter